MFVLQCIFTPRSNTRAQPAIWSTLEYVYQALGQRQLPGWPSQERSRPLDWETMLQDHGVASDKRSPPNQTWSVWVKFVTKERSLWAWAMIWQRRLHRPGFWCCPSNGGTGLQQQSVLDWAWESCNVFVTMQWSGSLELSQTAGRLEIQTALQKQMSSLNYTHWKLKFLWARRDKEIKWHSWDLITVLLLLVEDAA